MTFATLSFVIPAHREAENPEPRGDQRDVGPWVPDRASRVRNDERAGAPP